MKIIKRGNRKITKKKKTTTINKKLKAIRNGEDHKIVELKSFKIETENIDK